MTSSQSVILLLGKNRGIYSSEGKSGFEQEERNFRFLKKGGRELGGKEEENREEEKKREILLLQKGGKLRFKKGGIKINFQISRGKKDMDNKIIHTPGPE